MPQADTQSGGHPMSPPPPVTTSEFARRPSEAPVPPPSPPRGRAARIVARVMLWGLITVGALRGLVPLPAPPGPSTAAVPARPGQDGQAPRPGNFGQEQAATATAAAFLREYLTVDGDPAPRTMAGRLHSSSRWSTGPKGPRSAACPVPPRFRSIQL